MTMITMDNYEEYMVMHADGELQPHEEQALMDFLAAHPQLQGEMDIYSSIRLVPDTTIVFEGKEKLLKPVAAPKVIPMPWYRNYAVAAGVAAVVVLAAVYMLRTNGNANNVAESNQFAANVPAASNTVNGAVTPANTAKQTTNPTQENTTATENSTKENTGNAVQPAATVKQNNYIAAHTNTPKHGHVDNNNAVATNNPGQNLPVTRNADIMEMKQGGYKALPVEAATTENMAVASVDMPAIETATEQKETWFDKLPIDEHKKKNLNNVATAIASGCEKISTLKDNATKFGFSMRVEKKNLIVSF